jgi:hypothetical protein
MQKSNRLIARLIGSTVGVTLFMLLAAFTTSVPAYAASSIDNRSSIGSVTETAGVASSDPVVACQTCRVILRGDQPAIGTC